MHKHRFTLLIATLLLSGCGWTKPARDTLLTLTTDYRVSATNAHGMTIDYDPAYIDEATLESIAEKEASRYGKTVRPGALMVSHIPRVDQQFFEFVEPCATRCSAPATGIATVSASCLIDFHHPA